MSSQTHHAMIRPQLQPQNQRDKQTGYILGFRKENTHKQTLRRRAYQVSYRVGIYPEAFLKANM